MHQLVKSFAQLRRSTILSGVALVLCTSVPAQTRAVDRIDLAVIRPVMTCDQLGKADLGTVDGRRVTLQSAVVMDTPKGPYCKVGGSVDELAVFEVSLPLEHWTQRLVQMASNSSVIANAGSCAPALNGEMVVVFNNMAPGGRGSAPPVTSLQKRLDAARNNPAHITVQAAKAMIRIFYGQPQRFAYFMGCSAGGGQALGEVQRFPEDFDGVSAGSPLMISTVHNIFFHPWESYINKRADGSRILASSRMPLLHKAVMEHCAARAGELDGVLLQPTACKFDPAWVACGAGTADTSKCLTAEEVSVVEKLYDGPGDGRGHHFEIAGFSMGSELRWGLSTADHVANPEAGIGPRLKAALAPPDSDKSPEELQREFDYTQEWFDKILVLAPMFDSTNTNIRPFQQRGGKLILWNGAEDLTIQPEISVAYYQGVQKELGITRTDAFMRLFMIPGYGHCGGGEIPFQFDILTPLMAWTELHRAPTIILAGKGAEGASGSSDFARYPLAAPDQRNQFTRPIYPYPYMARYSGKGDPKHAANYKSVKSAAPVPQKFDTEVTTLIAPNNKKFYHVENGRPVPDN
jgi:feruloyl esterase